MKDQKGAAPKKSVAKTNKNEVLGDKIAIALAAMGRLLDAGRGVQHLLQHGQNAGSIDGGEKRLNTSLDNIYIELGLVTTSLGYKPKVEAVAEAPKAPLAPAKNAAPAKVPQLPKQPPAENDPAPGGAATGAGDAPKPGEPTASGPGQTGDGKTGGPEQK